MKHMKINCQKHKIVTQVQLHENLFISTCSFHWNNESGLELFLKKTYGEKLIYWKTCYWK